MNISYKPLIVAVFLVTVAFVASSFSPSGTNTLKIRGTLDGQSSLSPVLIGVAEGAEVMDSAALTEAPSLTMAADDTGVIASANGAVQDPGQPIGPVFNPSTAITYTVQRGDTLSGIAAHFNISVATIMSANPNMSKKVVQIGESLTIPGSSSAGANQTSSLPNFNSDFIIPAQGYDYGILDSNNGVNIVNACGTPVVAAADGIVVPDPTISDTLGGWNGGYGNFVLIEHAFGNDIHTRYAHLSQVTVQVGDYVKQGQQIGLMGQSGGVSSCQLDFEVIGAENPFAN